METLQLTKFQARQAIYTWRFAQVDLQHKDLNYVERQAATYNEKYDNIKEENGVFLWTRTSEGNTYTLTIDISDHTQLDVYDSVTINGQKFKVSDLLKFLNDLTDVEQKNILENMLLEDIEKYASQRTGIPIKFKKKIYQDNQGMWNMKLYTDNLVEHAGICKAMLKEITANTWGDVGYYIDKETGEQKLSKIILHFSYEHIDGGTNGHEFGRVRFNEKTSNFEGYNYETEKYEVI